jgi:hypothetical protein
LQSLAFVAGQASSAGSTSEHLNTPEEFVGVAMGCGPFSDKLQGVSHLFLTEIHGMTDD